MEKLENIFAKKENKEQPIMINELWERKDGRELSPTVVRDFAQFLTKRSEHRKGEITVFQVSHEEPLKVIFFTDEHESGDIVYLIKHNYKKRIFEIMRPKNQEDKITPLLKEFGLDIKE